MTQDIHLNLNVNTKEQKDVLVNDSELVALL